MAYPLIGARPINQVDVQEVLAVLRKLEATGRYESARRMRSVISRVFRYGIATARTETDAHPVTPARTQATPSPAMSS